MNTVATFLFFLSILAGVFLVLGWLPALVVGIFFLAKKRRRAGMVLTAVGTFWFVALATYAIVDSLTRDEMAKGPAPPPVVFDLKTHKGPLGTVVIPWQGDATLVAANAASRLAVTAAGGVFSLPPGDYVFERLTLAAEDAQGRPWTVACVELLKQRVREGKPLRIDCGPPFKARISARSRTASRIEMDLHLSNDAGYAFTLRGPAEGVGFVARDSSGQVFWKDRLTPGQGGVCWYSGPAPRTEAGPVTGAMTVVPVMEECPFEVTVLPTAVPAARPGSGLSG